MPIRVKGCHTAYAFVHHRTWDYVCRACLDKGKDVKMIIFEDYSGVWIKCPKCGIRERISFEGIPLA